MIICIDEQVSFVIENPHGSWHGFETNSNNEYCKLQPFIDLCNPICNYAYRFKRLYLPGQMDQQLYPISIVAMVVSDVYYIIPPCNYPLNQLVWNHVMTSNDMQDLQSSSLNFSGPATM